MSIGLRSTHNQAVMRDAFPASPLKIILNKQQQQRIIMAGKGFTLIEMMITIAIAAILITTAVPGFQEFIRNNRLATQANAFVTALQVARSEAIKRNLAVKMCESSNGRDCNKNQNSAGFEQGWIIFTDQNENDKVDANEVVININQGVPRYKDDAGNDIYSMTFKCISIENKGALCDGGEKKITYRPDGTSTANMTLRLCQKGSSTGRHIVINITGRPRVDPLEYTDCSG